MLSARRRVLGVAVAVGAVLVGIAGCGAASSTRPSQSVTSPSGRTAVSPSGSRAPAAASGVVASVAIFKLPVTLSRAVAVAIGGGDFDVLTGLHDGDRSTNAVLRVDPVRNTVTVASRLPTAVHDAAGGIVGGVPTVLGGGNATEVAQVQQPTPSPAVVGMLPVPISDAVAVATNRGLVVVGGYDGAHTLGQVLLISTPGHAEPIANLVVAVRYPAVSVIGSGAAQRILVIGGESSGVATDVVQSIDVATGRVTVAGHLPVATTQASALSLGGSVFVFGGAASGQTGAEVFSTVLRWVDATGPFVADGQLPYPVADAAAVTLDGRTGYLVGGETPARVASTIIVKGR